MKSQSQVVPGIPCPAVIRSVEQWDLTEQQRDAWYIHVDSLWIADAHLHQVHDSGNANFAHRRGKDHFLFWSEHDTFMTLLASQQQPAISES